MTDDPQSPQLYLRILLDTDPASLTADIAPLLGTGDIACVRLECGALDEDALRHAADAVREACHARDVAVLIERHFRLAEQLGLDGVHLIDGPKSYRDARRALGPDRIVGCFCGSSRHAGLTAAEMGADYVSFGPFQDTGSLGDGRLADIELVTWWAEMIETPIVVEDGLTPDILRSLSGHADFIAVRDEIWGAGADPTAALRAVLAAVSGT